MNEAYKTYDILFNVPPFTGNEFKYMQEAVDNQKICGDGPFTKKCDEWMEKRFGAKKAMLTTSGSSALDMAALLCGIEPGDEVILPSYTFSSTANAFVLAGAGLVFVDIRPDTMNMDETKIEEAITDKTKVICVVHYAGVACDMDAIMSIAARHGLMVVEDAAQAVMSTYKGRALGTIGDFGCFSFHETKNYSMGEGGAILINNEKYIERAEILREKGTNRSKFYRGQVAKYNWVDFGDSYLQSDLNAAYLWAQLERADEINNNRLETWNSYMDAFKSYADSGKITLPAVPDGCVHNAHMFYIKFADLETRQNYIAFMKQNRIMCVFHYVPLHSAPAGLKFGRFNGTDEYTTAESDRLVRLPMYYNMDKKDTEKVIEKTIEFLEEHDV
ncbi:MAG: dTDP-4-amino-4,6-dideoxygalactose transaminase [Lachnospiraceae bacterium]|nr:dTDP-4-amino-4,6-dideoxygalactose transaminase [Lachnospiraceae bacterium]